MHIKKININFYIIVLLVFVSIFDTHIGVLLNLKRMPLAEVILMIFVSYIFIINLLNDRKINYLFIFIFISITFTFLIGLFKNDKLYITIIGTVWLYKSFLAFYIGSQYSINKNKYSLLLRWIYYLSLISLSISILQLFFKINPFGFYRHRSYFIGLMDNPNKNGFILLFGFLFVNYFNKQYKYLLSFLFILFIILTESRQTQVILLIVFLYYFIIIKKYYYYALVFLIFVLGLFFNFKDTLFKRFNEIERILSGKYFRVKALKISGEALFENPLFGLGPGTWGGAVAHITKSKYHIKYALFDHWKYYKNLNIVPKTIDMYWPHMLTEVGVLLFSLNLFIYYFIFKTLKINNNFFSLLLYLIILIMSFFSMAFEATYISIPIFILIGINFRKKNYETL